MYLLTKNNRAIPYPNYKPKGRKIQCAYLGIPMNMSKKWDLCYNNIFIKLIFQDMHYIKMSFPNSKDNIYRIEISSSGDKTASRFTIEGISSEKQLINKVLCSDPSGRYAFNAERKFTDDEIGKYEISKEEFDTYWTK